MRVASWCCRVSELGRFLLGGVVIRVSVDEVMRAFRVVRTLVLVVHGLGVVIDVVVVVPVIERLS
jgi:hypothetical protein